ncbi:N-terminal nucleophile aminohydrolases (Ntn hydrolases) superfamily protein [Actinidia rufa]|uniref:N-terminal nucleophile aminohydrolases (Ntn hydrolases) superfamily protein n=1 Tax=Actinidia rufa TaxID=165716 RepID=A0A7J0EV49_9ERIC|nr:N-terminal nucleophile aminohydrolases (Ntn hydrolases) superfamily protein [Actinidia rufa]
MASSGFQADVRALQKVLAARHLGGTHSSQGSGSTLIMPFLDNQLKSPSPLLLPAKDAVTPLSEPEAIDLVKTCFASATERDIYTNLSFHHSVFCLSDNLKLPLDTIFFGSGDKLEIVVLNADGIRSEYMELRKD